VVLGAKLNILAQLRPIHDPGQVVRRYLVPRTATVLPEGDPGQQDRFARPGDQLLRRRQLKQLAKDEGSSLGIGKGSVSTAGHLQKPPKLAFPWVLTL
jgi:hypothetical protein